jgi:hypothetical protein
VHRKLGLFRSDNDRVIVVLQLLKQFLPSNPADFFGDFSIILRQWNRREPPASSAARQNRRAMNALLDESAIAPSCAAELSCRIDKPARARLLHRGRLAFRGYADAAASNPRREFSKRKNASPTRMPFQKHKL